MGLKIISLLLSIVLAMGNAYISKEKSMALEMVQERQESTMAEMKADPGENSGSEGNLEPKEDIGAREHAESEKKAEIEEYTGLEEKEESEEQIEPKKKAELEEPEELWKDEINMPVFYTARAAENERYVEKDGYFYIFVRKQGDSPENGHWYRLNVSVPELTAQKSQNITWDMNYIGKMPKKDTGNIRAWITIYGNGISREQDNYSLKIEKGKNWEKTRQDGLGINPVMGEPAPNLDELRPQGYPYKERYYMLCGKLLYTVNGYRMYFDNSVFSDMGGMDIEPENKQIQKKDSKLDKGEDSWTGDDYFKFSIDTNNVGMTNYGASGDFHHSMYGFYLKPNQYNVKYEANGGSGTVEEQTATYDKNLTLRENNFVREGYTFTGWSTVASGKGTNYNPGQTVKNLTAVHKETITLYAQWEPNIYTITLDRCLTDLKDKGTGMLYEKYEHGWYLDKRCTNLLEGRGITGNIAVPRKSGYVFLGYYNAAVGGAQMIDGTGKMTSAGKADFRHKGDAIWYAHYKCQVSCEDYADVPCDFEKISGDTREDTRVIISYENGKVMAEAGQAGFNVSIAGKPAGTKVGQFQSVAAGNSASVFSGNATVAVLSMVPQENAAYQLKVTAQGKVLCDRMVYFKNGRFRTVMKLGAKEEKEVGWGDSIAGSAWGTNEDAYPLYQYMGCNERKNIQSPGSVHRYFQYKSVNMAYSGNGATLGNNMLEYNVPLENIYRLQENNFSRKETQEKQTEDGKSYPCTVKYSFEGWNLSAEKSYLEQQSEPALHIYGQAKMDRAVLGRTIEPLESYQTIGTVLNGAHALEYINFLAKWNAFPTIVVTPGNSLEFYEGEDVTKEDLVNCLTAHDEEDNDKANQPYVPDLNDKVRIVKIVYPASQNGSQKAYENVYKEDVPKDFLLDTYYLKLEKEEETEVMVTFAVSDSNGNTTEEEIPVKVKYNNYPQINSEDIFYYFKEEANKGEITEETLAKRAAAEDVEDGNLTDKLGLKDFDGQVIKMQTESRSEFDITYQVTDAYKKTSYKTVKLAVIDEDAAIAEMPKHYVRYISQEYLDSLEENSAWRELENYAYLKQILENETSMETWKFTHEDVLAVQDWMAGNGNMEAGQETNRKFLAEFSHCRQ